MFCRNSSDIIYHVMVFEEKREMTLYHATGFASNEMKIVRI